MTGGKGATGKGERAEAANPFVGVWQRRSIQFDQHPPETSQQVLWIQAETAFGDVRRVPFAGRLTPERYRTMTWRQRFDTDLLGFTGTFTWLPTDNAHGTCTWHHTLAITPRSRPDTSHYEWIGPDDFLESGTCPDDTGQVHSFLEHWHRIYGGPVTPWEIDHPPHRGQALVAGPWAVIVYGPREGPSPGEAAGPLAGFSASAWSNSADTWQLLFGSHSCLATQPAWSPADLGIHNTDGCNP